MHRQPMIPERTVSIAALAAALSLAGCAQYAEVAEKRPRFMPNPAGVGLLQRAEKAITNALRRDRREPLAALGEYLTAAETAAQELRRNSGDASARRDYNFALGRVFATIRDAKLDPWTQPLRVPADGGEFVLTHTPDPRPQWNPALYEFVPADQFDVRGTYVAHRQGWPRRAARRDRPQAARGLPRDVFDGACLLRDHGACAFRWAPLRPLIRRSAQH
jgi:hypothetical protein